MKPWLHVLELWVDRVIPYAVVLLLVVIVAELVFHEQAEPYRLWFNLLDWAVVLVFCLDLAFKYVRVRNIPRFLRSSWLDIIAVFPFFLLFRIFEELGLALRLGEQITQAQPLFHEAVEIEKEAGKIIQESERVTKISRSGFAARLIRPLARSPRLLKILAYYEKPTGRHHPHEKKKKGSRIR
ncbi:MAG TPA: ion transporter [Candidatus Nanoarchaeia archaeon]|nr:ion transporter [Candidatus Nanoarchaeia archaeon]